MFWKASLTSTIRWPIASPWALRIIRLRMIPFVVFGIALGLGLSITEITSHPLVFSSPGKLFSEFWDYDDWLYVNK